MRVSVWVGEYREAQRGQIHLELEIQVGESYPTWVVGTQLGSSEQQMLLTTESSLQPQELCSWEFQVFSH